MEECCTHKYMAIKMLVLGIFFILITLYTDWNIGIVIGILLILKAVMIFFMPIWGNKKPQTKVIRKR